MFIMTFSVRNWFQIKSHFKRKNIISNNKKLNLRTTVFDFITIREGFLSSAFVISLWEKAPTSYLYSSQHVENGRDILVE